MFGHRCKECGEVRWSLRETELQPLDCPVCGAAMVEERRHPGHRRPPLEVERRDAPLDHLTTV